MNKAFGWISIGVAVLGVGCRSHETRPVPRVPVPAPFEEGGRATKSYEQLLPLRATGDDDRAAALPPPTFDDVPLVTEAVPEQSMYVDAYTRVGQPRVAVFVNRTIEGHILPVDERRVTGGTNVTRESTGAVDVETRRSSGSYDPWAGDRSKHDSDRFKTSGPARVSESTETYLAPGQYDETQAKSIDYEAIELALTDTLAANGKVTLISPKMARQRLSDEEVKELQAGRPQMLREVAEKLDADVLIQVQARPTKQTSQGLGVRILVEAMNTQGGESIARSFVDVPPPLDKPTINKYTRFLARKTMYELAGSWNAPPPRREQQQQPPPTTQPR